MARLATCVGQVWRLWAVMTSQGAYYWGWEILAEQAICHSSLPAPAMGLSLLCWVALCFWAAGKALFWNSCLPLQLAALPPGAALTGSLTSCFLTSICLLPPQAPRTQRSPRLPDMWSEERHRKQRRSAYLWKGTVMCIGIRRSQKKNSSFWFTYRMSKLLRKLNLLMNEYQFNAPKTHPVAWKFSPQK